MILGQSTGAWHYLFSSFWAWPSHDSVQNRRSRPRKNRKIITSSSCGVSRAHFCDRLCLPPSPFHHFVRIMISNFKKADAIKGNNLKEHFVAAHYYIFKLHPLFSKPMNRFDDKDVGHGILLDVFVDWSIVCMWPTFVFYSAFFVISLKTRNFLTVNLKQHCFEQQLQQYSHTRYHRAPLGCGFAASRSVAMRLLINLD